MGRSLKKGPYIDPKLEKKVQELSLATKNKLLKHGQGEQRYHLLLLG